jgi:uncharacterized membrane protein
MFKDLTVNVSTMKIKINHVVFLVFVLVLLVLAFIKSIALGVTLSICQLAIFVWAFLSTHSVNIKITPKEE